MGCGIDIAGKWHLTFSFLEIVIKTISIKIIFERIRSWKISLRDFKINPKMENKLKQALKRRNLYASPDGFRQKITF